MATRDAAGTGLVPALDPDGHRIGILSVVALAAALTAPGAAVALTPAQTAALAARDAKARSGTIAKANDRARAEALARWRAEMDARAHIELETQSRAMLEERMRAEAALLSARSSRLSVESPAPGTRPRPHAPVHALIVAPSGSPAAGTHSSTTTGSSGHGR